MNLTISIMVCYQTKDKKDIELALYQLEFYYKQHLITKHTYDSVKPELIKLLDDTEQQ